MGENGLLWKPGRIGPLQLRNRVMMAPMQTNFAGANGEVTDQMVAYYEERARGGVGLVIVEGTAVQRQLGTHGGTKPAADSDSFIPGLSRLVDAIHVHGAAAAVQLTHAGGSTTLRATGWVEPIGPSPVPHPHTGTVPRALSREEVLEQVEHFASAARRAQKAGFDAVEVHGAHSYLVSAFLSPLTNKRDDEFGGSTTGRARFACEIVRAIRRECGDGLAILFRISGDEFVEGGRALPETVEVARLLQNAGIDALHVSAGIGKMAASVEPASFEQGCRAHLAAECRRALSIPVITVGVIRYPEVAERILEEGKADYVALGRALIADPRWPQKARKGDLPGIRPCLSCNAGCAARAIFGSGSMTCAVNPRVGREWYAGVSSTPAKRPAGVAVVGGGPAGMQAAITAAEAGCEVHLFEASGRLGGQLWAAAASPHKRKMGWLLEHLRDQVRRNRVAVYLESTVTPSQAGGLPGDTVIVAVGSESSVPKIPGVHQSHVVAARDVLAELRSFPDSQVVVIGGGLVGCEAALFLAQSARRVVVIEQLPDLLQDAETLNRQDTLRLMREAGIRAIPGGRVREIKPGEVVAEYDGGAHVLEAETVVLATGAACRGEEWREWPMQGKAVAIVGDAVRPRSVLEAIREGLMAAELAALG